MADALIGYTGFVGSTLLAQHPFDEQFRSHNAGDMEGRHFRIVICAGAPGQKWLANRDPAADRGSIERLMRNLSRILCDRFVLISTVDVFTSPLGVDERSAIDDNGLAAYGRHRRLLEEFAIGRFARCMIVRLPGLVGAGLRKNVIFDLHNRKDLHSVDCRAVFQFYPTINLWRDIAIGLDHRLPILHLTAEPVSVEEAARIGFGRNFTNMLPAAPARYDMQSLHAGLFGGSGRYQCTKSQSLAAIRAFAQTERITAGRPVEAHP